MAKHTLLAAPQEALWNYLDALLQEIPQDQPEPDEIQDWDPAAMAPAQVALVAPAPVRVAEPESEPEVVLEPEPVVAEAEPLVIEAAEAVDQLPETIQQEQPDWATGEFQALLFSVGGLTLAVPLVTLHSVLPWPEEGVTPMPNQPAWCVGLMRYREQNVRIVDTGTMVIPSDRAELKPEEEPQHILIVGDGKWGLACNAIGSVVKLMPNDVRWRSGGQRPWLAGTVLSHLCALIDTQAFAHMLTAAGKQSAK